MDTREDFKRTTLRLPSALYERLESAAGKTKSVNALVIETLERAYPPTVDWDQVIARIEILNEAVDRLADPRKKTRAVNLQADLYSEIARRMARTGKTDAALGDVEEMMRRMNDLLEQVRSGTYGP